MRDNKKLHGVYCDVFLSQVGMPNCFDLLIFLYLCTTGPAIIAVAREEKRGNRGKAVDISKGLLWFRRKPYWGADDSSSHVLRLALGILWRNSKVHFRCRFRFSLSILCFAETGVKVLGAMQLAHVLLTNTVITTLDLSGVFFVRPARNVHGFASSSVSF